MNWQDCTLIVVNLPLLVGLIIRAVVEFKKMSKHSLVMCLGLPLLTFFPNCV